jgi:hypothetical protein
MFDGPSASEVAECSLTTGLVTELPHAAYAAEDGVYSYSTVTFGGTRAFAVAAGSTTTFRLVCAGNSTANIRVFSPVLTALFVPGS